MPNDEPKSAREVEIYEHRMGAERLMLEYTPQGNMTITLWEKAEDVFGNVYWTQGPIEESELLPYLTDSLRGNYEKVN